MPRRVAVLVNPTAGGGRGGRAARRAITQLRRRGLTVTAAASRTPQEATALAARAVRAGYDAVVAVGGDGMVHLVLQAVAGTGTPLGVVPAGTGNDAAAALRLPRADPQAAADVVADGVVRAVDAARVGDRWMLGVLAAGFDSRVNERANAMSWPPGRMRYPLAVLTALREFTPVRFTVDVDGVAHTQHAMLVAVGNSPCYGGGMRICPSARVDDGQLTVTVVGRLTRLELVGLFPRVYRGTHVRHRAVTVVTGRTVRLSAPGLVAYADGERVGPLPVQVTCVPGAVNMLVPAGEP